MRKTILITGAASEIGQAIIRSFLEKGHLVIATEIESEQRILQEFFESLSSQDQSRMVFYSLDLENDEEIPKFVDSLNGTYDVTDLVNVAGINILKSFFDWTPSDLRKVTEINWIGTFLLTKAIAAQMVKRGNVGTITTITSQHGMVANKERVPYCVSKAGLIHLTKVLGLELAPYGIRANCISPTYVKTDKNHHILLSNRYIENELGKIPLERYATPSDVAEAVMFLSAKSSKMMTGHNLVLDGGWTLQ
ncbi:SDR family NAD(P)-dependent oxidoreductase [Exiguobacterium sp. USCH10]|jgi:2-deoxy-D-gluconate 3-dehydrogenase|uniref:SDR family NAD(P)-dependent oxidoreductase n=1 Tax=Exiguobacterium sp. USCH10 TaxID=3024839 RepID=UPI00309F3BB3